MQSLSYVHFFIGFTFAFEIDHVQQGGERKESTGHSNSFGGGTAREYPTPHIHSLTADGADGTAEMQPLPRETRKQSRCTPEHDLHGLNHNSNFCICSVYNCTKDLVGYLFSDINILTF